MVTGVIGSEKQPFFDDPAVREVFAEHHLDVRVDTAGSRRIATDVDLAIYDFAFPSSAPAGVKIARNTAHLGLSTPFRSPMVLATFTPIMELLEAEGITSRRGEDWVLDMRAYVDLVDTGTRWRDLGETYPSPRTVQISTTDIRTSNSAAMYLAILSWILSGDETATAADVPELVTRIAPFFTAQGYTESTSAGPFGDYLSQGMGAKPMVMVYEAQFLGAALAGDTRITEDMTLAYLSPTTLSDHTVVELTEPGSEVTQLLRDDPELQRLAAAHGFRPTDSSVFTAELSGHGLTAPKLIVDTVAPPSYDVLESLLDGVAAHFTTPEPPEELAEIP